MLEHRALNGLLGHCLHPGNKDVVFNKDFASVRWSSLTFVLVFLTLTWNACSLLVSLSNWSVAEIT